MKGTMSVEKFKEVFTGLERAHGVYVPGEVKENGKRGGKSYIKKELYMYLYIY